MAFCFRIGYLILSNVVDGDAGDEYGGGGEFYDVLICFSTLQLLLQWTPFDGFFVCVCTCAMDGWMGDRFRIRRRVQ